MAVDISSSCHCLMPPRFPKRYHLEDHERGEGPFDPLLSPSDSHRSNETAPPSTPHRLQQNHQMIRLSLRSRKPNQRHQSKSPAISSAMGEYGGVEPRRSRRIAEKAPRRKHVSVISVNLVSHLVSLSCTHLHTPHDSPRPTIICIAKYAAASGQKRQAARIGCPPPASFSVM
jgi:hypothetical protein